MPRAGRERLIMIRYYARGTYTRTAETRKTARRLTRKGWRRVGLGEWRRAWWERDLMRLQELRAGEGARVQGMSWADRQRLGV